MEGDLCDVLPRPTPIDTTLMIAAKPSLLSLKLPEPPDAPAALSAAMSAAVDALLCDPYDVKTVAAPEVCAADGMAVLPADAVEDASVMVTGNV